jgi:NAD(P)-dependent dehydrogenase (short-subunit alcohol dehydrogenase family)
MPEDLTGEVAFITGASRGLGRALAAAFAEAGAGLVLCARGEDALARVAESVAPSAAVEWAAADVSDARSVEDLVARASARLGPITVLVNNASILGRRIPLREHSVEEWRSVLEVNLTGTLIPTLSVLPGMRELGRGSIINVSSGVGNVVRQRWGAYAISKWGVEALTKNLAREEAEAGIRVNVVDPGRLRTGMRRAAYPDEDPTEPTPPNEITPVFLWLAGHGSEGVTGERFRAQEWTRPS